MVARVPSHHADSQSEVRNPLQGAAFRTVAPRPGRDAFVTRHAAGAIPRGGPLQHTQAYAASDTWSRARAMVVARTVRSTPPAPNATPRSKAGSISTISGETLRRPQPQAAHRSPQRVEQPARVLQLAGGFAQCSHLDGKLATTPMAMCQRAALGNCQIVREKSARKRSLDDQPLDD